MANSGAVKQTNQKRERISQILRKNECQSCDKTGVKMCVDMKICIQLPYIYTEIMNQLSSTEQQME